MAPRSVRAVRPPRGPRPRFTSARTMSPLSHPPQISPQIAIRQRLRYTCTTSVNQVGISYADLCDTIFVATSGTAGFDLFDAVRVHAVEVWYSPSQSAAPGQVAVTFSGTAGGSAGDGRTWSDQSMGVTPAHVRAVPDPLSNAGLWQATGGAFAFTLTCPSGSVIDLTMSMRTVAQTAPIPIQNAGLGMRGGDVYFRGLDGIPASTTSLPAVAPTTA